MIKRICQTISRVTALALLGLLGILASTNATADEALNQWVSIHPQGINNSLGGAVRGVAFGPGTRAYAVSFRNQLFSRESSSQPWQYVPVVFENTQLNVTRVTADRENANVIFITTRGASSSGTPLLKSVDGGNTWTSVLDVQSNEGVRIVAFAPSDPNVVYATLFVSGQAAQDLLRSDNGGLTWNVVNNTHLTGISIKMEVDAVDPNTLYVLEVIGNLPLSRSVDGGATWVELFSDVSMSDPIFAFAVDPNLAGTLFAGTGEFFINGATRIYRSTNHGDNWDEVGVPASMSAGEVRGLAIHPVNPDIVYATAGSPGHSVFYRSLDSGRNWTVLEDPDDLNTWGTIAVSSLGEVLVGSEQGLTTINTQEQVVTSNQGFSDVLLSASFLPKGGSELIYSFNEFVGVIATNPALPNWSLRRAGLGSTIYQLAVYGDDGEMLLAGTNSGLFSSQDGGRNWTFVDWPYEIKFVIDLAVAPADPARIYAETWVGLVTSPDGGVNWNLGLRREGYPSQGISGPLVASSFNANIAYIGTRGDGIYHTVDGGESWQQMLTPFSNVGVTDIVEAPGTNGVLWVVTSEGEVWRRSANAMQSWQNRSANLPTNPLASQLAIDPFVKGRVFASNLFHVWALNPLTDSWQFFNGPPRVFGFKAHLSADQNVPGRIVLTQGTLSQYQADSDNDGVGDALDNCILIANSAQQDTDSDDIGNACDADIAPKINDCLVNFLDLATIKQAFESTPDDANWNADADFNSDEVVNFADVALFTILFLKGPGASGLSQHCQ